MECLSVPSLKFQVTSSDNNLIRSNFIVHAYPSTTVMRLLQYIHCRIYEQIQAESAEIKVIDTSDEEQPDDLFSLGHVSEYCLFHGLNILPLLKKLNCIDPENTNGVIKLEFEKCAKQFIYREELHYSIKNEFRTTNIQIEMNLLSTNATLDIFEYNIPLNTNLKQLKEIVLHHLIRYEGEEHSANKCGIGKKHNIMDLEELKIKGKKNTIYLNESRCTDDYNDLTLSELFNIDFSLSESSYYQVNFKVLHDEQTTSSIKQFRIEFIADANLTTNQMFISSDTTVEDVKEYICNTYANSLRLYHRDITLFYQSYHLHTLNAAGKLSLIMEYIDKPEGAKINVLISQEFIKPGPGFWFELFSSPHIFNFMYSNSYWEPDRSTSPLTNLGTSLTEVSKAIFFKNPIASQFIMAPSVVIKRTGKIYGSYMVNEETEVLIDHNEFEPLISLPAVNNTDIPLLQNDYYINPNSIQLSEHVMKGVESKNQSSHKHIQSNKNSPDTHHRRTVRRNRNESQPNQFKFKIRDEIIYLYPFISLIRESLTLLSLNIIFALNIIIQNGKYFPLLYTLLIALFSLINIYVCSTEIL